MISKIAFVLSLVLFLQKSAPAQQGVAIKKNVRPTIDKRSLSVINGNNILNGIYRIKSSTADLYISSSSDSPTVTWVFSLTDLKSYSSSNNKWQITPLQNGFYDIHLVGGRLKLFAKSFKNSSAVSTSNYKPSVKWEIRKVGEGKFVILAGGTNLCVEGQGNPNYKPFEFGAGILHLWEYQEPQASNQVWTLIKDQVSTIKNKAPVRKAYFHRMN